MGILEKNKLFGKVHIPGDKSLYTNERNLKRIYNRLDISEWKGSVLYLGMGSLWLARHQPKEVTRTVIVEIDKDVIEKYKHFAKNIGNYEIVHKDIYEFETNELFDVIFIDIFCSPITLKTWLYTEDKFRKNLKPNGVIDGMAPRLPLIRDKIKNS